MEQGHIVYKLPKTADARVFALNNIKFLKDKYKKLAGNEIYPIKISAKLQKLVREFSKLLKSRQ